MQGMSVAYPLHQHRVIDQRRSSSVSARLARVKTTSPSWAEFLARFAAFALATFFVERGLG